MQKEKVGQVPDDCGEELKKKVELDEVLIINLIGFTVVKAFSEEVLFKVSWRTIKSWAVDSTGDAFRFDYLSKKDNDGSFIFAVKVLSAEQPEDLLQAIMEWLAKKKEQVESNRRDVTNPGNGSQAK